MVVSGIQLVADQGAWPLHFSYTGDAERAEQDPYCPVKLHAINCCQMGCYNRTTDMSEFAKHSQAYDAYTGLPPFTMANAIFLMRGTASPGVRTIGEACKGTIIMTLIHMAEMNLGNLLTPSLMQYRRDEIDGMMAAARVNEPGEYSEIMNAYPIEHARNHLYRKMSAMLERINRTELSSTINLSEEDQAAGRWKTVYIYDGEHNQSDAVLGAFVDGSIDTKGVRSDGDGWRSLEVFVHPHYQFVKDRRVEDIHGQYHGQVQEKS